MTSRIIRMPRVSERAYLLPVNPSPLASEQEVEAEGAPEEEEEAEPVEPVVVEPEPEPRPSAAEVEALVEERVKAFDQRYQSEREGAYRSGFEDGQAQGLKAGRAESKEAADRFAELVEAFQERQRALVRENETALVDLAIAVARRIVGASVAIEREPVLLAVSDCLGYLRDRTRVIVKVNPKDLDVVRETRKEWLAGVEGIGTLSIEANESIARGGCVLETDSGDVDARVEERLSMLHQALLDQVRTSGRKEGAP